MNRKVGISLLLVLFLAGPQLFSCGGDETTDTPADTGPDGPTAVFDFPDADDASANDSGNGSADLTTDSDSTEDVPPGDVLIRDVPPDLPPDTNVADTSAGDDVSTSTGEVRVVHAYFGLAGVNVRAESLAGGSVQLTTAALEYPLAVRVVSVPTGTYNIVVEEAVTDGASFEVEVQVVAGERVDILLLGGNPGGADPVLWVVPGGFDAPANGAARVRVLNALTNQTNATPITVYLFEDGTPHVDGLAQYTLSSQEGVNVPIANLGEVVLFGTAQEVTYSMPNGSLQAGDQTTVVVIGWAPYSRPNGPGAARLLLLDDHAVRVIEQDGVVAFLNAVAAPGEAMPFGLLVGDGDGGLEIAASLGYGEVTDFYRAPPGLDLQVVASFDGGLGTPSNAVNLGVGRRYLGVLAGNANTPTLHLYEETMVAEELSGVAVLFANSNAGELSAHVSAGAGTPFDIGGTAEAPVPWGQTDPTREGFPLAATNTEIPVVVDLDGAESFGSVNIPETARRGFLVLGGASGAVMGNQLSLIWVDTTSYLPFNTQVFVLGE